MQSIFMQGEPKMKTIENIIPILKISDMKKTITYYNEKLGFGLNWQEGDLAEVARDGFRIMFRRAAKCTPQEIWIGLHELESIYDEYTANKAIIFQHPKNNPWAYDMKIKDIDGNILWFGAESKSEDE